MSMDPGPFGDVERFDTDHDGFNETVGHSVPMADLPLVNAPSLYAVDANMDFVTDTMIADTDGDHLPDTYLMDTNLDGYIDTVEIDGDQDGRIEARLFDSNGDGVPDVIQLVDEQTGLVTHQALDANGDGIDDYHREAGPRARVAYNAFMDASGLWHIRYADIPVPTTPVVDEPDVPREWGQQEGAEHSPEPIFTQPVDPAPTPGSPDEPVETTTQPAADAAPPNSGLPAGGKSLIDLYGEVADRPIDRNDAEAVARRQETLDGLQRLIEQQQAHMQRIIDNV